MGDLEHLPGAKAPTDVVGAVEDANEIAHKELDKLQLGGKTTIHDLMNFIRKHILDERKVVNSATTPNPPVTPVASFDAEKHYDRH